MRDEISYRQTADLLFASRGWVKAGDMWGDAQWKRVAPHLIVCIGGASVAKDLDLGSDEFARAPEKIDLPCIVRIFFGPFYEGEATWEPGNFPLDETGRDIAYCVTRIFSDAMAALEFVDRLNPMEVS